MVHLDRIHIKGYKSIQDQEIELGKLNVLIGANGAGKTNFVSVFKLLNQIASSNLQVFVGQSGGADQLLHFGQRQTDYLRLKFNFGLSTYECKLLPARQDTLIFGEERCHERKQPETLKINLGGGHKESLLPKISEEMIATHPLQVFDSWRIYHFHDTSTSAKVKQTGDLADNRFLRPDASNLAAFLYLLQETKPRNYRNIVDTIRMAAPFFDSFNLAPDRLNPQKIKLEWFERGSDTYFDAHALSDGTLRFMGLATLLLQPELPSTILLDEPELGLHPFAIGLLADLLQSAAENTQVITSTQSVTLVNQFTPEDIVVVNRVDGNSVFKRFSSKEIESWMDNYSLGELWEKNVIGGRPAH